MYNMNPNLTAPQPHPDIYAILSSDDPTPMNGPIDTDALVMGIFDTDYSTTTSTMSNTAAAATTPVVQPPFFDEHPLSNHSTSNNSIESNNNSTSFPTPTSTFSSTTASNEFNFHQDLINFDINTTNSTSNHNHSQYTPTSSSNVILDPFFSPNYPHEDPIFSAPNFTFPSSGRRHSVAVTGGGGINELNLRISFQQPSPPSFTPATAALTQQQQQQQQQSRQRMLPQQPPSFARRKLATVVESEPQPNMMHRASMPNIFLSEESRRQLNANIQQRTMSARTTPNNTPPPVSINFNQMPWSTNNNNTNTNNNDHQQQEHQHDWNPFIKQEPIEQEHIPEQQQPIVGRKRFYSQQFDSFPTHQTSNPPPFRQLQQPSNLCPLPMSGILSRRTSIATPNDIHTWNRKVNPNDRIALERKRRASMLEDGSNAAAAANATNKFMNTHVKKRIKQEEDTESIGSAEDTNAEDYPLITEADLEAAKKDPNAIPRRQKLRYEGDEYTPKWVRYTGQLKEGYCDTCKPGKWLQLKNSAFWYHKQFFHGISSVSGKPFQKPLEQRAGDHDVVEGLCHQCKQFVPICNSKRKNSVLWYRHAHKCHIYDKPKVKGAKRASISVTPTPPTTGFDQPQKIY